MRSFWIQVTATVVGAIIAAWAIDNMRAPLQGTINNRMRQMP